MHGRYALLILSLPLERDEHGDCVARGDVLSVLDLERELNRRVPVAHARNVGEVRGRHGQQLDALSIIHLHQLEDRLDARRFGPHRDLARHVRQLQEDGVAIP